MLEKIKKMEDMNQKELMDLVCYVSINQSTLYYSKISSINEKKLNMVYDGNQCDISPESVKPIINGKNRYELYKLMNSQEDFSKKVKEETEKNVNGIFKDIIDEVVLSLNEDKHKIFDELDNEKRNLFTELNEIKHNSSFYIEGMKSTFTKLKENTLKIDSFLDKVDFESLEKDISNGVKSLKPLQEEFNSVVKDLKKLFK